MLSADQFARVKTLFNQICDLPVAERRQALEQLKDEADVVAEVRLLLDRTEAHADQVMQPVVSALASMSTAPRPGDVLGVWTLHEEIGEGGMGKVFLARRSDGHFEQVAAIKLLAGRPSAAALRYLARERQILASLSHPNIARLLDGGSTPQGQPYLVMEYVEGLPIHSYCRKQGLALAARLRLLIDVCAAVAHAHQQLVVHCDLKPGNVLVTSQGRPLLLDFGVARLVNAAEWVSGPGDTAVKADAAVTGAAYTPRYASPEQKARGLVGTASDIYSLGLMLAELLGLQWSDGKLPPLQMLPGELTAIIERATRPEASDRYPSVDEFAADLRRYLAHEVVMARPPSALYIVRKWLRRNWSWVAVAGVFLALLGGFTLQMRSERDNALRAEQAARAVKDYMVSVFQAADPEMSGQRDLPVSALLDAGRDHLQSALTNEPRTRAELANILGSVYQSIGQREQALALFEESIQLARRQSMPQVLAQALHNKAYSLYDMGEFGTALAPAREALALRERDVPDSGERISSMRLVGSILGYSGDTTEAPRLLNQALEMASRLRGIDSVEAGSAHLDLARYYGGAGGHADLVLMHSQRAEELFSFHLGPQHFRAADALELRTLGMAQSRKADQAIDLARELVARRTALYGDVSHPRSYALNVLGSLLWRGGRGLEAIPVIQGSLDIHEQLDGAESVASLIPMLTLAQVNEDAGAHQQALALFERQLAIHLQHHPMTQITPAGLRVHIARNLRALDRLDEAEAALAALLTDGHADAATAPEDLFDAQLERAALALAQGDLTTAQAAIQACTRVGLVDDAERDGQLLAVRGRMALAQSEPEEARSLFDQAHAQIIAARGARAPEAWLLRLDFAEWIKQSGATADAQTLATEIATQVKTAIDPDGRWARRLRDLGAPI